MAAGKADSNQGFASSPPSPATTTENPGLCTKGMGQVFRRNLARGTISWRKGRSRSKETRTIGRLCGYWPCAAMMALSATVRSAVAALTSASASVSSAVSAACTAPDNACAA